MLRTVKNLFLILSICFLASIMPVNPSQFQFQQNFLGNFTLNKPYNEIEAISSSYKTNLNESSLYNPTNIEFTMIGKLDKGAFILGENHDMILEVFNNGQFVRKYVNTEFVTGLINVDNEDNQLKYSFDISQENLELDNGIYTLKIYSTGEAFKSISPYEISANYLGNFTYIPAKNDVEDGHMYLTLYFPDKNYEHLVPVSRKLPYTNKTIRTSIDNLLLGPNSSLGLSSGSPIPDIPRVWVRNKIAYLNLPNDIGKYGQTSAQAIFAVDTFVSTLTNLNGVDKIKFLQNGRTPSSELFHGLNIEESFEKNKSPKAYLGLQTNTERLLLAPVEISSKSIEMNDLVPKIFNSLKTSIVNDIHYKNLITTIPEDLELLNFDYSDGLLTLNFNTKLLNISDDKKNVRHLLLDSILYSFTSIPNVNKISIKVNSNSLDSFGGTNVSEPLAPPKFINPEN
ncbi:GerMN domain-containing protein [Maledivibacter halophilus]|uniref:Sporulation and spore germination n=1 Tax=Maledivibacter halophilus TaxID=36842 RepID=A0A1T5MX74_9FIRM|nr:GerMN domain-containing protein [Maledivibacter halophilus]SKC92810.1 Sporulation and spore germination [Maledivibacter halophilus]